MKDKNVRLKEMWRRFFSLFIIFTFFLSFCISPFTFAYPQDLMKGASLEKREGFLIVHLKGTPFQMGFQQGHLLRKYISQLYRDYFLGELLATSSKSRFKRWIALQYFKIKARQLEKYIPAEYRQEMKGIAAGSGLPYSVILLMHTFLDTMSLLRKIHKSCTNFVFLPSLTEENKLYHGRNLGFSPRKNLYRNRVIFFFEPRRGFPFVSIGWPGMCGVLTGMNINKISLGETGVGTSDLSRKGCPIMFLLREIVQYSPDIWYALREICKSKRICGYTITVADGKTDRAFVAEVAAKRYEIIFPESESLIAVNHYLSQRLFNTMKAVYPHTRLEDTGSYKRLIKFKEILKNNRQFNVNQILEILRTPPIGTPGETLQSVLFVPQDLKLYVLLKNRKTLTFYIDKQFPKKYRLVFTQDPFEFFKNYKKKCSPVLQKVEDKKYYKKLSFVYKSEVDLDIPDRDIWIYLFMPKRKGRLPCFVCLSHSAGVSRYIEENIAEFLVQKGFVFLTLESGFQKFHHKYRDIMRRKTPLERVIIYVDLIKELMVETQNILDWLEDRDFIDNRRIALGGLSLGSIISEALLGLRSEIKTGVFLLGGADLETLFLKSRIFKKYRVALEKDENSIESLIAATGFIDPLNFSFKAKDKNILMINALFDRDMPKESTLGLWRSLEHPQIYWLAQGHYTSFLSLGFVENKILEFLDSSLNRKTISEKSGGFEIFAPTGEKAHLKYKHRKFKIILGGKYSSYENKFKIGFEKEEIFDTPFLYGLHLDERWESDDRYNLRGEPMYDLYLGTPVTRFTNLYMGFSSSKYDVYDLDAEAPVEIRRYKGESIVNFLNLKLLRNTTNDKIYPTKGSYFKIVGNLSSEAVGSDFNFYRLQLECRHYCDLERGRVFVLRTKWGYLDSFGASGEVPFFEKFYLGGASTIRGYRGRRVGVLDDRLLPLGGDFFGVFNLEYRFPVYKRFIYSAVFFDTGFLVDKVRNFSGDEFRCGMGFGLRFRTKWGFGKADFGFKVGFDKESSRSKIHLSFGLPF